MVKSIGGVGKQFFVQQYEKANEAVKDSGFKQTLKDVGDQLNAVQQDATSSVTEVLTGNNIESHNVMIAAQEAGLAFELMLEVRNKLLEAYHEIMRMQV